MVYFISLLVDLAPFKSLEIFLIKNQLKFQKIISVWVGQMTKKIKKYLQVKLSLFSRDFIILIVE